jgi:transcription antitermination protein NusB
MLYQMDMTNVSIDKVINQYWQNKQRTDDVVAFANEIAKGTYEHLSEIDRIISSYSENWKLSEMPVVDRNIIRFAVYEIMFMDDIPPAATIDEAVDLANRFSTPNSGKFINGVLDKIMLANKTVISNQ